MNSPTESAYESAIQRLAARPAIGTKLDRIAARTTPLAPVPLSANLAPALGRIPVDYADGTGTRSLDRIPAGTSVSAIGTISAARVHGSEDAPRSTFTLSTSTGDSTIVAVGMDHYLDVFGYVVDGREVEVQGDVTRPFESMPAFIQAVAVLPRS